MLAGCAGTSSSSPSQSRPEGIATLLLSIDETGRVTGVQLKKSSGYSEFDQSAMEAARKQRFSPALKDGKPVASSKEIQLRFMLAPGQPDNPQTLEQMQSPQPE